MIAGGVARVGAIDPVARRDVMGTPGVGTIAPDIYVSGATTGGAERTDRFRVPYGGYCRPSTVHGDDETEVLI